MSRPVLADSRDATAYAKVLRNQRAHSVLRKYEDLPLAMQVVEQAELPLRLARLRDRAAILRDEMEKLDEVEPDVTLAVQELFRLVRERSGSQCQSKTILPDLYANIDAYGTYARASALADYVEVAAWSRGSYSEATLADVIKDNDWVRRMHDLVRLPDDRRDEEPVEAGDATADGGVGDEPWRAASGTVFDDSAIAPTPWGIRTLSVSPRFFKSGWPTVRTRAST